MTGNEGRSDRAIQDFLDGRIDEDELRRRVGSGGEGAGELRLEEEIGAYRAVWEGLAEEPELRLGAGFARRAARAAVADRAGTSRDRLMDVLLAASIVVPAAGAAAGLGILLPAAGVEVAPLAAAAAEGAGRVPLGAWGAAASAAVLYAADWAWTAWRPGSDGTA